MSPITVLVTALFRYPVKGMAGVPVERAVLAPAGLEGDRTWLVVREDGGFVTQRQLPRLALVRPELTGRGLRLHAGAAAPDRAPLTVPEPAAEDLGGRDGPAAPGRRLVRVWGDEVHALDAGDAAAAWLAGVLGMPDLRLVRAVPGAGLRRDPARFGAGAGVCFADAAPLLVASTASLDALGAALRARDRAPVPMDRFRPNVVVRGLAPFAEHGSLRLAGPGWTLRLVDPCERCVVPTIDQGTGVRDPEHEPYRTLVDLNPVPGAPGRPAFGQNAVVEAGIGAPLRVGERASVHG